MTTTTGATLENGTPGEPLILDSGGDDFTGIPLSLLDLSELGLTETDVANANLPNCDMTLEYFLNAVQLSQTKGKTS